MNINYNKLFFLFILICIVILIIACLSQDEIELVEVKTSEKIYIFDGRTGEEINLTRKDYISRINAISSNLRYHNKLDILQDPGSSYNLTYKDNNGEKICTISMSWPEAIVFIDNVGYEIYDEDKFLLYGLIADAMYLNLYENK